MRLMGLVGAALALCCAVVSEAKVIGTMSPAEPVTEARIRTLPQAEQPDWLRYLERSQARHRADKASLAAEREPLAELPLSPKAGSPRTMPLNRPADWYGSAEALRIADNIVSFQTPSGGWGKDQDRTAPPRVRGQSFAAAQEARIAALSRTKLPVWSYAGTIDNGATHSEMRFLARVQRQFAGGNGDVYRTAFGKGLRYLLEAQYPSGGWPQIYPLQGGYKDAITFNDGAVAEVTLLIAEIGDRHGDFAFVSVADAEKAKAAADRAVRMILQAQVHVDGKRALWGQQHDALTLAPVGGRNYEPAALASHESVGVIDLLRARAGQTAEGRDAVDTAIAWLAARAIRDAAWRTDVTRGEGRFLVPEPGSGPLWPRYYDLQTGLPIFGDRDRSIHDDVNDISLERRNGYSWFNRRPCQITGICAPTSATP